MLNWLKAHQGDKKCLPHSDRGGWNAYQQELCPLRGQIAVMFGRPEGTLDDLKEGFEKLLTALGERTPTIVCQCCERSVLKNGHKDDCPILVGYQELTSTEPKGYRR